MKRPSILRPALEQIDFQSDLFFKDLTAAFKKAKSINFRDYDYRDKMVAAATELSTILDSHTNLNMSVRLSYEGAHASWTKLDANHLFSQKLSTPASVNDTNAMLIDYYNDIHAGIFKGTVDLKKGKVGGKFADVYLGRINICIAELFDGNIAPEELAATFLHEVGHVFSYLELLGRMSHTNQILADITRRLDGTTTSDERETVIVTSMDKLAIAKTEVDAAELKDRDPTAILTVLIATHLKALGHQADNYGYDDTTAEAIADQFVTRCGAGRYLAVTLNKSNRVNNPHIYRSTGMHVVLEALKVITPFATVAASVVAASVAPSILVVGSVIWANLVMSGKKITTGIYDTPADRATRIRQGMLEQLKIKDLSKELITQIDQDLAVVDAIIKNINQNRTLYQVLTDFMSSSSRNKLKSMALQQNIEKLVANDLFRYAAKLR